MRIALTTDTPYNSGIGKYSYNLHSALRHIGVNVDSYFLRWSLTHFVPTGEVKLLDSMPFPVPIRSVEAFFSHLLKESLIPKGYDVYHVAHQFLIAILPSHGVRIATVHDLKPLVIPEDYPFLLKFVLGRILSRAYELDLILVDSRATKSDLCTLFRIPERKIRVVPLGVSEVFTPRPNARALLGLRSDSKIIIHVGTEDRSKNIPFLLKVLQMLSKRVDDLLLIRVGQKSPATQRLIQKLSLENKVLYVKSLSDERLAYHYSAADLLLFPSRYEGFGLPTLEAMSSGCPVMCSNTSSLPEVVDDAGSVVPLNVDEWVERAYSLLTKRELWEYYKEQGLKRAGEFSWLKCAKETEKAYLDAVR